MTWIKTKIRYFLLNMYFYLQGWRGYFRFKIKKLFISKLKPNSPLAESIISVEKIQKLCDLYLGEYFHNPFIRGDSKCLRFSSIKKPFKNPFLIYCYGGMENFLAERLSFFTNPFVLVTNGTDDSISSTPVTEKLLNSPKIIKWYGQNCLISHPKLEPLPIGLAALMWKQGDLSVFNDQEFNDHLHDKSNKIFFNFKIKTNKLLRQDCYDQLNNKIEFLKKVNFKHYICTLKDHAFCICPQGNGVDTHRFWESLYVKTVPIVTSNPLIENLKRFHIPMLVLKNWKDLEPEKLNYSDYSFDDPVFVNYIDFRNYEKRFRQALPLDQW